jgi:hypothetical protein
MRERKMSIYNTIKAEMIKAGIEEPERFLVRPGTTSSAPPREFGVLVEFWLHPARDVMCCKVAGNTLEISRKDLEEKNYAPFFDAMYEALDGVLDMDGPVSKPSPPPLPELTAPDLIFEGEQDGTGKKAHS